MELFLEQCVVGEFPLAGSWEGKVLYTAWGPLSFTCLEHREATWVPGGPGHCVSAINSGLSRPSLELLRRHFERYTALPASCYAKLVALSCRLCPSGGVHSK